MTKGADDDTEMEAGMTTSERRRRRRRGGGLRIPSDNVPRRTGPVVAPVPEDPSVAMSIAYAFTDPGDDASAPARLPTGDLEVDSSGLGDMDDATSIAPRPDLDHAPDGSVPGAPAHEDVAPDGRTRQMAAVSLEALGLTDVEHALDEDAGNGLNTTADIDHDVDGIEDAPDDDDGGGDDFGETEAPIQRRAATIPPPMPLAAAMTAERARTDVEAPEAREAREARLARDTEQPRGAPQRAKASGGDADGVVAARMPRAATVALSEDDLEELLEMTPPPQEPPKPPPEGAATPVPVDPTWASPPPHRQSRQGPTPSDLASSIVAAVPEAISATPASPSMSTNVPQAGAPTSAAVGMVTGEAVALAEEDLQEVASPNDAGDSGELLADEIVEVEQESRAPAVIAPQASGPVPAPHAAHQAPPPPPAASAHAKPPAKPPAAAAAKKPLAARHAQAAAASASTSPSSEGERKKRRGKPWFEEVFDEDYLRTLPFLTPQATQAEAMMVIDSLGVPAGASVLDVGCGYGRHAMELAARGYHVVGVDLSLPLLLRGADEAQRRGLDINFVHADMREMDFDAQFDGAYCLFSTFGFFDDETNKKTATLIAKALKPGAKFMLEILNRDYVIGDLPARVWWEGDGCVVLEEVEFNYFSSRVQSKRSVVFDDGRQVEQEISVRVYSLHEVGKLLHAAGLRVLEVSGSMAARGRFLGTRSREIIVVAERRPPDGKG